MTDPVSIAAVAEKNTIRTLIAAAPMTSIIVAAGIGFALAVLLDLIF